MKRVAIYTRVSTDAQTTENQQREMGSVMSSVVGSWSAVPRGGISGR